MERAFTVHFVLIQAVKAQHFSCHKFTSNSVTWVTNYFYVAQLIEYNLTVKL